MAHLGRPGRRRLIGPSVPPGSLAGTISPISTSSPSASRSGPRTAPHLPTPEGAASRMPGSGCRRSRAGTRCALTGRGGALVTHPLIAIESGHATTRRYRCSRLRHRSGHRFLSDGGSRVRGGRRPCRGDRPGRAAGHARQRGQCHVVLRLAAAHGRWRSARGYRLSLRQPGRCGSALRGPGCGRRPRPSAAVRRTVGSALCLGSRPRWERRRSVRPLWSDDRVGLSDHEHTGSGPGPRLLRKSSRWHRQLPLPRRGGSPIRRARPRLLAPWHRSGSGARCRHPAPGVLPLGLRRRLRRRGRHFENGGRPHPRGARRPAMG